MAEAATNPGAHLRGIREQRGISLHQLAVELHVSDSLIQALETGDYAALGGAVFVRGHLRNYARALGVAEGEVLSLYDQGQNKPVAPNLMTQPTHVGGVSPRAREWYMRAATGGVVVVLLVLAVSWWQRRPEEPAAVPANQAQSAPLPAPAASTAAASVPLPALSEAANTPPPAQQQAARLSTPLAPAPVKPAPTPRPQQEHKAATSAAAGPAPTPTQAPNQSATAAGGLTHVKFILSSASWIEVYDDSGKRIYYDLAPAGGSLDLDGLGPLQVFLGNAPGVSVELNGTAFDIKAYSRADNTARFKLGTAGGKGN
jgi:cytoskeleton protein RodZ